MKKLFTLSVLLVLTCLLGNSALAQNRTTYTTSTEIKETIDFTGWVGVNGDNPQATIDWNVPSITATNANGQTETRSYTNFPISVETPDRWHLWKGSHGQTYLQKNTLDDTFYISNLKTGDIVTIWGDTGDQDGGFKVTSGNTNYNNQNISFNNDNHQANQTLTMGADGTLALYFYNRYSGILKIEIKRQINQTTTFDYDPGYEEYDMYDEFSWEKNGNPATTYSNSGSAGFQLNGKNANYVTFSGSKITTNNRIALTENNWTFDFGLVPPGENDDYSYMSICNLREGDRVVISYINESEDPLIFASGYKDGAYYYDGCTAFKDENRDGVMNNGDEYINIENGEVVTVDWHRGEGNVGNNDWGGNNSPYTPELYYTNSYVITEDGHLDLAFRRFVQDKNGDNPKKVSRIVKIKIFSDHQAMMVDEYDANSYKAYYNIPGELQAKEHIMPGGLEIQVGNDDATQHALVVSSKDGPVSYVNAVDGFKIPGVSKNGDQVSINFDLGINRNFDNLPTSGTFYKFIPEVNGKMKFKFEAKSMNYYRWDLKGNSVYQNTSLGGDWGELNDRPNEQTVDAACPYYLVTVENGHITNVQNLGNISNGGEYEKSEFNVQLGKEYYLFGGWNQDGLYYTSSWTTPAISADDVNNDASSKQYNNIEFRPFDGRTIGCGIAQLLWVEFNPDKKIYPLAKWVPNGTTAVKTGNGVPNPDTFETEYDLADLYGYNDKTSITVKKMAGNITACNPYLQRVQTQPGEAEHFKLMIDGITFDSNKDKGGTILIKIGDATKKSSPVYTLTIAYSGDSQFDGNSGAGTRGHIWDYSSKSLHGLKYDETVVSAVSGTQPGQITVYTHNAAELEDYGHYFQNYFGADISSYSSADAVFNGLAQSASGKLHDEINSGTSEWMFNYNLVNDGKLYDPVFTNKYDLEADNADLIWETEGTVIRTSANASVMFNEFTGDVSQSTVDPDRYVGILKGGEFRIPWLMPNDRVIIHMGTGKGAFNDQAVFNIRGAYDAVHNAIDPSDDYIVGGSLWNGDEKEYKGCYHFFAQGHNGGPADMVFNMKTGSMCKIYSIQIYRGDRIITNEIVEKAAADNPFLLYSMKADPNEASSTNYTDNTTHEWALKYLGKEQQLANGTGNNSQDNEIIAKTGKYSSATPALTDNHKDAEDETSPVESFTYNHQLGEIGTFRMRGKDMEKGMNYVADYADHNVTIAYQETQTYPYTWDFTDVTGIAANVTNLFVPEEQLGEEETAPAGSGISDDDWEAAEESYQRTARDLSLWEVNSTNGNYFLRLNSQSSQTPQNLMKQDNIFETAKEIGGNQVWANGTIVPEMQGLWFYTDNNNQKNGEWNLIKGDANNVGGLEFDGSDPLFKKIVVPNVPAKSAVYLRLTNIAENGAVIKYRFRNGDFLDLEDNGPDKENATGTVRFYEIGSTGDYIVALLNGNSKSNLTLALNGYRIQKLAVSTDFKKVNKFGWATESRARKIDPSLTSELTGNTFKHYIVTGASHADLTVTLTEIDNGVYMPEASEDGNQAYIIRNMDVDTDKSNPEPGLVKILKVNGAWGFHLFVPDMNDYLESRPNGDYRSNRKTPQSVSDNLLLARLNGDLSQKDGYIYNYVLTTSTTSTGTGNVIDYDDVVFARVPAQGMTGGKNVGYLPVDCSDGNNGGAKMSIVFTTFDEPVENVETTIETPLENVISNENAVYYNLNGQKIDGKPTKGIYVVNGKKIVVK